MYKNSNNIHKGNAIYWIITTILNKNAIILLICINQEAVILYKAKFRYYKPSVRSMDRCRPSNTWLIMKFLCCDISKSLRFKSQKRLGDSLVFYKKTVKAFFLPKINLVTCSLSIIHAIEKHPKRVKVVATHINNIP